MHLITSKTGNIYTDSKLCALADFDKTLAELIQRFTEENPHAITSSISHQVCVIPPVNQLHVSLLVTFHNRPAAAFAGQAAVAGGVGAVAAGAGVGAAGRAEGTASADQQDAQGEEGDDLPW